MRQKAVSPKIDPQSHEFYEKVFSTVNSGVSYAIEMFPALYRNSLGELKGKFEKLELQLILDVMNGCSLTPQLAGHHITANCSDGILLDNLDKKWKVDKNVFLPKLRNITLAQAVSLEIWAQSYWEKNRGDEWLEQLL